MLKKSPPQPDEPLEDRIERFRAELEKFIDEKVEEMGLSCPGVPRQVLKNLAENRAPGCRCLQALELLRSST
jgi:hypothetical protein